MIARFARDRRNADSAKKFMTAHILSSYQVVSNFDVEKGQNAV